MPQKKSLSTTYLLRSVSIACLFLSLLGVTWIALDYQHHTEHIASSREALLEAKKEELSIRANEASDFLEYMQSTTVDRLKDDVRDRVEEAHHLCTLLFDKALTREEAVRDIRNALTAARFHDGMGFFFAFDMGGTVQENALKPDLVGTNLYQAKDVKGQPYIQNLLEIARDKGEGFHQYYWAKPGAAAGEYLKISYVKYFEPLGWVIGSGLYVDDVTAKIQEEALEVLENRLYSDKGYLFCGTYDGLSLLGPAKGRDMWDITDANGVKIVQELVRSAKAGGGFVSYVLPGFDGGPSYSKISYARGIAPWSWYIGAGFDTSEVELQVLSQEQQFKERMRGILALITALILTFMGTATFALRRASSSMRRDFSAFIDFFDQATQEVRLIDRERLQFEEFDRLARAANTTIEERFRAELALRRSEEDYRAIFESIMDGFYRTDMNGTILLANPAAARITGFDHPEEIQGKNLAKDFLKNPEQRDEYRQQLMRDGRMDGYVTEVVRKDGSIIRTETNARLVRDQTTGEPLAVEALFRDITERQRTQEFLIQSEKMFSVGGLAAGMAHEINNPLGGILQGVQNVLRRLSPGVPANQKAAAEFGVDLAALDRYMEARSIPKMLEGIRASGERAADIVQNMLNFSRKSESKRVDCDLHALINQAVELASSDYDLKKKYDFRKVEIVRAFDATLPQVFCTENEIVQVLLNLLKNAAQAMHEARTPSPCITLSTRLDRHSAVIEVADNGPGMDEAVRRRVFEPFFTTKPPGSGTGLGLSVSFFIVTANHNGTFEVESHPGEGTRFIIRLPLRPHAG